jgi:hypothetical protein
VELDAVLRLDEDAGAFRRLLAERPHEPSSAARRLAATADAVAASLALERLVYAGEAPRRLDDADYGHAVAAYLDEFRARRRRGEPAVFVLTDAPGGTASLFYDVEPAPGAATEYVWVPLDDRPGRAVVTLDAVVSLVVDIAESFSPSSAFVEDEGLLAAYRGRRAFERTQEALPEELREHIPAPPRAGENLPDLLVPQEFDRHKVPSGIWWVNFWSDDQLEAVGGRRLVERAPWERLVETLDGLVLVATAEPTDPTQPDHAARLRELFAVIDLRAAQERHRGEPA